MKPWHLNSEAKREHIIELFSDVVTWELLDVGRAAIAVLREAAPWPDEALVVSAYVYQDEGRYELEIVDTDSTGCLLCLDASGEEHWRLPESCEPLTPAAAEFLAAMGGGE